MRRLVNNFLFGETSKLLAGRLDSDVYGNSCAWLENMYVHRQGGISRRPPLKGLCIAGGYVKGIPFIVDRAHVYAVLLGEGVIGIYDYLNNTIDETLDLPSSWLSIADNECKDVRYAQYYNDLYLVHGSFPLMRVRYTGTFIVSTPQVVVNQDVNPHSILLSLTMTGTTVSENISFTFNGESHSFTTQTSSVDTLIETILGFDYTGFTASKSSENTILFVPDDTMGKYRLYDLNDPTQFGFTNSDTFVPTFSISDEDADTGLVYGSDDFRDMYLNRTDPMGITHYASDIEIVSEKMVLIVNGNPSMVYASRPYSTSQVIYPSRSNDTILDFVQFELVATTTNVMKDEMDMPVVVMTDAGGETVYEGSTTDQKLWLKPTDDRITDKRSLDEWLNGYYQNGVFVPNSAHLLVCEYDTVKRNIVTKLKRITTTEKTLEDYIERSNEYYQTYDTEADTSKLLRDNVTGVYSTNKYYYKVVEEPENEGDEPTISYHLITIDDAGTHGLKNTYALTEDRSVNPKGYYYTRTGTAPNYTYTLVSDPVKSGLGSYYEKTVTFTDLVAKPVYEYGPQYVFSGTHDLLRVEYLENGRIGTLSYEGVELVSAVPYYQFNMNAESAIFEDRTEVDKVATASTGIEFQIASGKNDKITWVRLGDSLMIGTESAEWRISPKANALDMDISMYSSYGSVEGLSVNMGADLVYLQKGNVLRLMYTDNWGLQNMELTVTNPEIMEGQIVEMASVVSPEPAVYALKSDGSIVNLCVDRVNSVQAFSRWTFKDDVISMFVLEKDAKQYVCALVTDGESTYLAEFDSDEDTHFSDCKLVYGNSDVSIEQNATAYDSIMTANPFDTIMQDGSVTIGDAKNVSKIIFRCMDTGHITTYYNEKDMNTTRVPVCCDKTGTYIGGLADHAVNVNGGTTRDLMITVKSVGDEPMTLLAMAYDVRTNRNG